MTNNAIDCDSTIGNVCCLLVKLYDMVILSPHAYPAMVILLKSGCPSTEMALNITGSFIILLPDSWALNVSYYRTYIIITFN